MYKVFLVEDEIVVREGIRNSIPWDKTPYTLTGEAPDGEMALSMIQDIKPDIVITDIRMPFMDGLTFSRIIRKTLPWIKIIILSGHDEFEYAREAVSLGVEEYLLKPVSSSDMLKTLEKIAKRIDEEKEKLLNIENLKKQVRSSSDSLRDKWLSDFVNGRIPPADAIEKGRELGIDLFARSYTVATIGVTGLEENEGPLISVKMIIDSIMEKHPGSIWFSENDKRFVLLVREIPAGESPHPERFDEEQVYTITQALKYDVERNTGFKIAVGIGPTAERLSEVAKSYSSALKVLNYQMLKGMAQISDSTILPSGDEAFNPAGLLNIDGDMLFTKMKYMAKKDIESAIMEYTRVIENDFGGNNMLVYFIFGEIIVAASKIVEALGGDLRKISPFSLDQAAVQDIANSRDIFFEKIRTLLEAVIEFRDAHTGGRYQLVIMKAREYIDHNFASEDISLYSTASYVGISPNHLSTVFAQETGENFIEYLTRVRIDKAKNLLKNTAMKSAEIAYEIGFNDPHYFSYIFKKNTGFTPREYRGLYRS
ncbi:MAG: response regulator [Treponema sp.]|jgi:two-component system response regulator YesN|nr:response regulator [Treponema sp.]